MVRETLSHDAITEADRYRVKYSGHGNARGAAGYISATDTRQHASFLSRPGQTAVINPHEHGYEDFFIGFAWDNVEVKEGNIFERIFKKARKLGVDLDLGCLYELANGSRGCIQAFGEMYGNLSGPPFIGLSGDERTGNRRGPDEMVKVTGEKWPDIKKILVYVYIYGGVENWAAVKPQIQVLVPGEDPVVVTLATIRKDMPICAIAGLENVRNGILLKTYLEYYPGHAEMDRAFGFGLAWEDGKKQTRPDKEAPPSE